MTIRIMENGVCVFSEGRLVNYDRSHFFTFKLDTPYLADADTSLMGKAMRMWFKNDWRSYNSDLLGLLLDRLHESFFN